MPTYSVGLHPAFRQDIKDWASLMPDFATRREKRKAVLDLCVTFDVSPRRMLLYKRVGSVEIRIAIFRHGSSSRCLAASVEEGTLKVVFLAAGPTREIAGDRGVELA